MVADRLIGTQIGNHTLRQLLGRGRMGSVYLAEHDVIGRQVAVKILHPELTADLEMAERFSREATMAARIEHGNIVQVLDFGSLADGTLYLVMEYVAGGTLRELIRDKGRLPLIHAINIVHQIARALAAAHDKGVVHRDVKPANILVERRPGRRDLVYVPFDPAAPLELVRELSFDFVKVCDFGLAKLLESKGRRLTRAGATLGTPEYIAPEVLGGAAVTPLADVYALGLIFYLLSSGQLPFTGQTTMETLRRTMEEPAPAPTAVVPGADLTDAAETLIMRAIDRQPERRPASMDDFMDELQRCYGRVIYRRKLGDITLPPPVEENPLVDEQLDLTAAEALQELLDEGSTMIIDRTRGEMATAPGSPLPPADLSGEPTLILPLEPPPTVPAPVAEEPPAPQPAAGPPEAPLRRRTFGALFRSFWSQSR